MKTDSPPPPTSAAVVVRGLRKTYPAARGGETATPRPTVAIEAFSLAAGEQLALCGESGCGKSTFLQLVAGILTPDAGTITVAGEAMAPAGERARDRLRARAVGQVFQTFNLLRGFTCLENLLLPMRFAGAVDEWRARELLAQMGVGGCAARLPGALSVGQQQRVAIARALVNRPALVLADEPTANLDARHAALALSLLHDACAEHGAALLLVSHDERALAGFPAVRDFAELNRPLAEAGVG
ncbi:MAG: ATP-binding cassette domain-containing protein [Opitutaceae bacterium]